MARIRRGRRSQRVGLDAVAGSPLLFFVNVLLMLLALAGSLLCLVSSFPIQPDLAFLMPVCLLLVLVSCVVFTLPRIRWLSLAVLCQGLSAVVRAYWDMVLEGTAAVVTQVVNTMADKIEAVGYLPPLPQVTALRWSRSVTLVLFLGLALLALYLGWSVVNRRSAFWTFLPTFSLVLPSLLAEQWPWWPALMALVACWITLLLCGLSSRRAPLAAARLAAASLPITCALLVALSLLLPQRGYRQPDWAVRAYGQAVDLAARMASSYQSQGVSGALTALTAGSATSASLNGAGNPGYSGRTMLEITATKPQRLYLRGASLGNYEDGRWTPLPDEAYDTLPVQLDLQGIGQPLLYPASLVDTAGDSRLRASTSVTIRNLRATGRYLYVPYVPAASSLAESEFDLDMGVLAGTGQRRYQLTSFDMVGDWLTTWPGLSNEAAQAERAYRAFVYQNYLTIPRDFWERIQPWLSQQIGLELPQISTEDVPQHYATAIYAARIWPAVLAATTQYDLDIEPAPEGEDPLVHFLNDSRRGYCMHYASAATLLLRYSGIPARYVSGFVADVAPGVTRVPDSSAHAWVEIYLDGYGWYPVEVTPPAGVTGTATPSATVDAPEPDSEPAPEPEPEPEAEAKPDAPSPTEPESTAPAKVAPPWLRVLLLPLLAALLVGLLVLRRTLVARHRRRAMTPADPNRAVLAAYGWLTRLLPWGAVTTDQVEELARKAKFSQHTLTQDECQAVLSHLFAEARRLDKDLPLHRRLLLRYGCALL